MLGPATRLLWRSTDTVHLEMGSRSVVVEGLAPALVTRIASRAPVPVAAAVMPAERRVLDTLTRSGYLWTRTDSDDVRRVPPAPRLGPELTALAARHGEHAVELLDARHNASIVIHGRGRAAAHLAALLAAAGIGRVHCMGGGSARLLHAAPGGVLPADEGHDLALAADAAILRAAPEADTTPPPVGEGPDLTILAVDTPIDDDRRVALHAAGTAHLAVRLATDYGVVGPLVLPGLTSCLRCADLHRRDRDPAWPALAVQLTVGGRMGPASDVAMTTVVVGVAALQALAFLDGDEPACIDGTLELRLPDWRLRRRSWPAHPECDCAASEPPW